MRPESPREFDVLPPLPVSGVPCWVHVPPERVYTNAVAVVPLATPPIRAVLPSAERATSEPKPLELLAHGDGKHVATNSFGPCCDQTPPERVNTNTAPSKSSSGAATSAVLPSAETATLLPNRPAPVSSEPLSFGPCWIQVPPERTNTQTEPTLPLSAGPPIRAVLPSADRVTTPNAPAPVSLVPVTLWLPAGSEDLSEPDTARGDRLHAGQATLSPVSRLPVGAVRGRRAPLGSRI